MEEELLQEYDLYIRKCCRTYINAPYYEDMIQDIKVYLLECFRKDKMYLFKKHLVSRICRSRDKNRNTIHIPEWCYKDVEIEYANPYIKGDFEGEISIFELLPSKSKSEDDMVNSILIEQFATPKDMEIIQLRNQGYRDVDICKMLNMSSNICNARMNKLKDRIKKSVIL